MQQYTRQQLIGHVRYAPHALMGNWSEELELKRTVLKDFMQKKDNGTLQLDRYNERMAIALADVDATKIADDGFVHFGDVLQLRHCDTGAALAVDVEERDLRPGEKAVGATATPDITHPVARNTFILAKYTPAVPSAYDVPFPDDVLRYGQKVRILANPMAQAEPLDAAGGARPLALFSKPISVTHYAKYSRHQLAGFTWRRETYDAVWQVVTPDPARRVASEGVEVAAGAPLLLVHAATQQALCLEGPKRNVPNDFGYEHEVSAFSAVSPAMQSQMEFGTAGLLTKTLPKAEAGPNHWCFVTGEAVGRLPAARDGGPEVDAVVAAVAKQLAGRTGGVDALAKKLVPLQADDGTLLVDEFLQALKQLAVEAEPEALETLIAGFPVASRPKHVNTRAIVFALRAVA